MPGPSALPFLASRRWVVWGIGQRSKPLGSGGKPCGWKCTWDTRWCRNYGGVDYLEVIADDTQQHEVASMISRGTEEEEAAVEGESGMPRERG
eukprot:g20761.t1